jgi:hypothetical protein
MPKTSLLQQSLQTLEVRGLKQDGDRSSRLS